MRLACDWACDCPPGRPPPASSPTPVARPPARLPVRPLARRLLLRSLTYPPARPPARPPACPPGLPDAPIPAHPPPMSSTQLSPTRKTHSAIVHSLSTRRSGPRPHSDTLETPLRFTRPRSLHLTRSCVGGETIGARRRMSHASASTHMMPDLPDALSSAKRDDAPSSRRHGPRLPEDTQAPNAKKRSRAKLFASAR